jgi:hypothetical protein
LQTTFFFQANDTYSNLIPNSCTQQRTETRNYLLQLHKINTLSYLAIIQVTFLCNEPIGTHCLFAVTVRQTVKLVSFVFYLKKEAHDFIAEAQSVSGTEFH